MTALPSAEAFRKGVRSFVSGSLWAIILIPILAVSGYSLYFVARYLQAPWYIAIALSTCFDGVAILAADYSVRYAELGLSGGVPRTIVRLFALIGAFLQTFHARLGHEPAGSWVLWASLPIGAVLVYEMHIRWARRKALARGGHVYPAPLPSFGLMAWVLFPWTTLVKMRVIVERRRGALVAAAEKVTDDFIKRTSRPIVTERLRDPEPEEDVVNEDEVVVPNEELEVHRQRRKGRGNAHAPTRHIRKWAQGQPDRFGPIGDRARLPGHIVAAYEQEVERAAGDG